jgi:hypothetical protein
VAAEDEEVTFEPDLELEWLVGPDVEIVFEPEDE